MNSSPSGGEDLHIVQGEKSSPRPGDSVTPDLPKSDPGPLPVGKGRFSFVASLLLIAATFSLGLSYFFEKRWLSRSSATNSHSSGAATLVEPGTAAPSVLGPDAFQVSAVTLAGRHFAVVNGKRVWEGESLVVATSGGPVTVRVARIEEGVVHFLAGDEKIDAKVRPGLAQETAP